MEIISVGMNDSYDVLCFDLYLVNLKNLWRQRDVHMLCSSWHFMFICIVKRSKFITKIQIWRYKYFRRTLFCCLWFYLRYTVGTQHECVPNFSYPLSIPKYPQMYSAWFWHSVIIYQISSLMRSLEHMKHLCSKNNQLRYMKNKLVHPVRTEEFSKQT